MYEIREIVEADKELVRDIVINSWGSDIMITREKVHHVLDYPGYLAFEDSKVVGLITYRIEGSDCEILSLDSFLENNGIGTALLARVEDYSKSVKVRNIWLITTNDNTRALKFYQKREYDIVAIHRDAVTRTRKLKPEIPMTGFDGISIRHEIELSKSKDW